MTSTIDGSQAPGLRCLGGGNALGSIIKAASAVARLQKERVRKLTEARNEHEFGSYQEFRIHR
jgi:hypothetical protein